MASMDNVSFTLGECFSTYDDLETKLKAYESARFVQMARRDSRTLEAAKKRVPKRVEGANDKLLYYHLHFACVFGGRHFKSKSAKERRQQSTLKIGCTAGIKFVLSDDRQCLKVVDCNENHNHEISKDIYDHLPRQRRLGENEREEAENFLKMKVDKKLLQQHLIEKTGKFITMKDINNIQAKIHSKPQLSDKAGKGVAQKNINNTQSRIYNNSKKNDALDTRFSASKDSTVEHYEDNVLDPTKPVLSHHEKFTKAQALAMQLSSLICEVGMTEFEERMAVLKQLRDTWISNGSKASTQSCDSEDRSRVGEGSCNEASSEHNAMNVSKNPLFALLSSHKGLSPRDTQQGSALNNVRFIVLNTTAFSNTAKAVPVININEMESEIAETEVASEHSGELQDPGIDELHTTEIISTPQSPCQTSSEPCHQTKRNKFSRRRATNALHDSLSKNEVVNRKRSRR